MAHQEGCRGMLDLASPQSPVFAGEIDVEIEVEEEEAEVNPMP